MDAEDKKIKDTALFEKEFITSERRHPPKQFNYKQITVQYHLSSYEVNTGCGGGSEEKGTAVGDSGKDSQRPLGKR